MGGIAALAALGVILFPNAVRSALCLVLNFFVLAGLYFTLGAELLGITQIVVYTGAIMVLFLFVIMLLNLAAPQQLNEKGDIKKPLGVVMGLGMLALILAQLQVAIGKDFGPRSEANFGTPEVVGRTLFTLYAFPLEIVGILLVVGIVGSILLAKRKI
ncbi:MAG: NADH-quinone oxidoreductase subunit J [Armatimonadetes bacterium]|nr:NADH-quinone oxidoreductase subunit J [Armatimonadota bacterium]